ncbi:polysaccharide pyruvyl transferase family protein [Nocardioides sp. W7]|uniref:polysaccharide pyruvyl transferase family protein n=1 Tax=Nocardioides sp. W7 TaxID=2931390 RepID=UPI001FD251A0|nr:polysaccharide pyruvyl transferase family protein [Nocardioides sp. W7]
MTAQISRPENGGHSQRVLVRTLPLSTGNYGGILQAWALQQVLRDLGYEAAVDLSTTVLPPERLRRRFRRRAELLVAHWAPKGWAPEPATKRALRPYVHQQILQFLDRLETAHLYDEGGRIDLDLVRATDAFVVGSDQIWRADYGDVASYLLDGVPADHPGPRIAFAASFGVDTPSPRLQNHRSAAASLTSVSVREDSGVAACRQLWGVEATRMVDPTMLIPASRYVDELSAAERTDGGLVTYVLDWDETKRAIVEDCAQRLGVPARQILPMTIPGYRQVRADPSRYWYPSVEEWLTDLSSADFIITDSFHGTVFAILFNKPFLVIPNVERGTARFDTILRLFGLRNRLVTDRHAAQIASEGSINWPDVNARLQSERKRALDFLAVGLKSPVQADLPPSSERPEE